MRCPAATRCGTPAASVAGAAFIGEQGGEEGVGKAWARGIGEGGGVADGFGRLTLSCSSSVSGSYRKKKRGRARETRKRAGGRLGIRMRTTQGRASRRRHGQAAGWRAARGPTANGVREREKERVERKNDSTKLSSILTAQNLKFHIETRKFPRMKVVQNLISSNFCFRQNFI